MSYPEPNYTQIPNLFLDQEMQDLGEAELRVYLYLLRRTGGRSVPATISLSQFKQGNLGEDRGCGVKGRHNITVALRTLVDLHLIVCYPGHSATSTPNRYSIVGGR